MFPNNWVRAARPLAAAVAASSASVPQPAPNPATLFGQHQVDGAWWKTDMRATILRYFINTSLGQSQKDKLVANCIKLTHDHNPKLIPMLGRTPV